MDQLLPGLKPLLLWMANAIELLHFIQHHVPQLLPFRGPPGGRGGPEVLPGSEVLSTQTACEEAMTVLEEVIMFTFQQSVYYLTKVSSSNPHQNLLSRPGSHAEQEVRPVETPGCVWIEPVPGRTQ